MNTPKFIIENVSSATDGQLFNMILKVINGTKLSKRSLNEFSIGGQIYNVSVEKKNYGYKIVVVDFPNNEEEK